MRDHGYAGNMEAGDFPLPSYKSGRERGMIFTPDGDTARPRVWIRRTRAA
jgi:hypothetical protein